MFGTFKGLEASFLIKEGGLKVLFFLQNRIKTFFEHNMNSNIHHTISSEIISHLMLILYLKSTLSHSWFYEPEPHKS